LLANFCYNAWRKHVLLDKGISGTSRKWRFCLYYSSYLPLLAKLKLSCLCALLKGRRSAHGRPRNSCLPFFISKIKVFFIISSFPCFLVSSFPSLYLTSLCLTSLYLTSLYLTSLYLTSLCLTSFCLTSFCPTSLCPTSLYLTSFYLTSLYLISQGVLIGHFRGQLKFRGHFYKAF